MKGKKKPLGTKAQVRAIKERQKRIARAIFLIFILSMVILSAYFAYILLEPSPVQNSVGPTLQFKPENPNSQLKAVIVDQVSLTFPNQAFIQTAANMLERANYSVDYYSGEKVTVDFFRNLPTHGYGIVILRVHSTAIGLQGKENTQIPVVLFTSEIYTQHRYVLELLKDQLEIGSYVELQPPYYFAITPAFVKSAMNGGFKDTTVVMMGCEGINNTGMAEAFVEEGAKIYISWNGPVSADHTDQATTNLLQHLILDKQTMQQAVENTMKEVGRDPESKSALSYYPEEAGDYAIQNP